MKKAQLIEVVPGRYASAGAVAKALEGWMKQNPMPKPAPAWVGPGWMVEGDAIVHRHLGRIENWKQEVSRVVRP